MKIGFIGLGIMGSRMADNLLAGGHELIVHNRTKDKAATLIDKGAKWADSYSSTADDTEVLITMLSTPETVREAALGPDGFISRLAKGSIWLNCSTVNPSFAMEMAKVAAKYGIIYIDGPVAGTKGPAEKGELVFLIGGDKDSVDRIGPLLDLMGKKTIFLGTAGNGSNMKMLINLLLAQSMLAFSEAMVLGEQMGLKSDTLFNVLLGVPVTAPFLSLVRAKMENNDYEANFPLQWIHKDIHLATLTAYEKGVSMPSLNIAKEIFSLANQNGYGTYDFSAIYDYLKSGSA